MARTAFSTALVSAALAGATPVCVGVFETTDDTASIEIEEYLPPPVFAGGITDFSLICWVRRTTWEEGEYFNVLDGGSVLCLGFDDDADGVRVEMCGAPADISLLVPLRDTSPETKVPVDEWMLVAASWNAAEQRLTAWAQSETVSRVSDTAADAQWSGDAPWPITLGATATSRGFAGQLGLTVIRDHQIDDSDLDEIWSGGAPHYFAPFNLETGNMTGWPGVAWMTAYGAVTQPHHTLNPLAEGAELGDPVTVNNLLVYNTGDAGDYYDVGKITAVTGTWTLRSPHELGAVWSGFFVRELPDLGIPGNHYVSCYSPKARRFADNDPDGLIRVMAAGNSRSIRTVSAYYGGFENWPFGGLYLARKENMAGVIVGAAPTFPPWHFLRQTAKIVGEVTDSRHTSRNSVAFGNFTISGSLNMVHFPMYQLAGRAQVIEDGSSFIPKARPESGTLFHHKTQPVTVRAMLLKFPGSGDVIHQGEKATWQLATESTTVGELETTVLDTTEYVYAMGPQDMFSPSQATMTLTGVHSAIQPGHGVFISEGEGQDGFSFVVDVDTSSGVSTILTLERWFPADPDNTTSILKFGPVEPIWVGYEWPGLDPGDPEYYRGVNLTASGGIVVVLFIECFRPDVNGFVAGMSGQSGAGYQLQLQKLFSEFGVTYFKGLQADVWLMFFAQQMSPPECMAAFADAIRDQWPQSEIWWCGDPDLDTTVNDISYTDAWQSWILNNAALNEVGAIVAHEDPRIGTGNERILDGQAANDGHLTARGNKLYLDAVLEMMQTAALTDPYPCPADVNGDGQVNVMDMLAVLAAWGPCGPSCPADVNGDDVVNVLDLLAVLSAWGPCP